MPAYRWPIPDPTEEGYSDQTAVVLFCIPNTPDWRRLITGIIDSLSFGWAWDERTGHIKTVQATGRDIFESMCIMDCTVFERMAVATEAIAAALNATDKNGQTITLAQIAYNTSGDITLQDFIDEMQAQAAANADYSFKDILETMLYMRDLAPNLFPNLRLPDLGAIWANVKQSRWNHNHLTLMAYQATALRGIQNALAPFEPDEENDEESIVQQIYNGLDQIPWEKIAIAAMGAAAEPTPVGETTLAAAGIAATLKSAWDTLSGLFSNWWNKWINEVETPTPSQTVVGAILELKNQTPTQNSLTLTQIVNNISTIVGDDDTADYPAAYKMLLDVLDFLPDQFTDRYVIDDPAAFIQAIMQAQNSELIAEMSKVVEGIRCICEGIGTLAYQPQLPTIGAGYNTAGAYRCDAAKWYLGKVDEYWQMVRDEATAALPAWQDFTWSVTEGFAQLVRLGAHLLGFKDDVIGAGIAAMEVSTSADVLTIVTDLRATWLADIYSAASPDAAVVAMMASLDNFTPSGYTITAEMSNALETFFIRSQGLDRVFVLESDPLAVTQAEVDTYGTWSSVSCDAETIPQSEFLCSPTRQNELIFGDGDIVTPGPVYALVNGSVAAEIEIPTTTRTIRLKMDGLYRVRASVDSSGTEFYAMDCGGNFSPTSPTALTSGQFYEFECAEFYISHDTSDFEATIEFLTTELTEMPDWSIL